MAAEARLRILFVEDMPEDAELAQYELRKAGLRFEGERVCTREEFLEAFPRLEPSIIISDYSMPRFDGMKALQLAREIDHDIPFIVLTGSKNEETAVQCMKAGANDYVIKSHIGRLPYAVREALEKARAMADREASIAALRESEENYRALADSGQALIWTSGADGGCDWFNQIWLDFTGRPLGAELGSGWLEGVHPDDRERCMACYLEAFERHGKFSMEYRLRRRDGAYRWIQDVGSPRYSENGAFRGYVGHCLDVTERVESRNRMAEALAEKEALLRELFHRTRNNMQVIMAILSFQADILRNPLVDKVVQDTNDRIMSMSLVHRKLYESQDLSRIDLKEYAQDLVSYLAQDLPQLGERIAVRADFEPISVLIDTAMPFAMVINELLTNAVRHAFPGDRRGTVSVSISKDHRGRVTLVVSDDGVGLPPGLDPRGGQTLGFLLVHGLVREQMRGDLEIESSGGVTCRVSFVDPGAIKRI